MDEYRGTLWTDQETNWLIRNYGPKTAIACAVYLSRSAMAVRLKVHHLRREGRMPRRNDPRETSPNGGAHARKNLVLEQGVKAGALPCGGGPAPIDAASRAPN